MSESGEVGTSGREDSSMKGELWARLLEIEGVVESSSIFADRPALFVDGTEIAHEGADGAYDIRLTRRVIRETRRRLRSEPSVRLRPSSSADWVDLHVSSEADGALLVELVQLAAGAHRPPAGRALRPPPEGADLARRRRLH